jgi:hypothetical protein
VLHNVCTRYPRIYNRNYFFPLNLFFSPGMWELSGNRSIGILLSSSVYETITCLDHLVTETHNQGCVCNKQSNGCIQIQGHRHKMVLSCFRSKCFVLLFASGFIPRNVPQRAAKIIIGIPVNILLSMYRMELLVSQCNCFYLHCLFPFAETTLQYKKGCSKSIYYFLNIPYWGEKDLNLRRLSQQIYSLPPLTTREPPQ